MSRQRHRRHRHPDAALTLGTPAGFGGFTAAVANTYSATHDGQRRLDRRRRDPERGRHVRHGPGHLVNGTFSLPSALKAKATATQAEWAARSRTSGAPPPPTSLLTYGAPTSNDAVTLAFQQHVGRHGTR